VVVCGCSQPRVQLPYSPLLAPTQRRGNEMMQPGVFYTVYLLRVGQEEHGLIEELWQYLDEDSPEGPSPDLLHKNNLCVGVLQPRFLDAARGVLESMQTLAMSATPTFCAAGRVQFFASGLPRSNVTVFVWTAEDRVSGTTYDSAIHRLKVTAVPRGDQVAELVLTPTLETSSTREELRALATRVRCPVGGSVLVSAVDSQRSGRDLGSFFQHRQPLTQNSEVIIMLTVDRVVTKESR